MISKAHALDAGYDLVATHDELVSSAGVTKIHTGITGDVPPGHVGLVCSRSGLAAKHGVIVLNAPGILDSGFQGEVCILLSKVGEGSFPIRKGDRIAQLVYVPLSAYTPGVSSSRGDGGFGSTGQ